MTEKQIKQILTVMSGSVFFSLSILAEEKLPEETRPTIVVTPDSNHTTEFQSPLLNSDKQQGFSQTLDISKSQEVSPSLSRVVRSRIPVIIQETLGAGSSRASFLVNGFSSDQFQVYLDEIPLATGVGGDAFTLLSQTSSLIEGIELKRGVHQLGSFGQGSSRMGAGLYLTTLKSTSFAEHERSNRMNLKLGEYGLRQLGAVSAGPLQRSLNEDFLIAVSHRDNVGDYPVAGHALDNNASRTSFVLLKYRNRKREVGLQLGSRRSEVVGSLFNRFKALSEKQTMARVDARGNFVSDSLETHFYGITDSYTLSDPLREIVTTEVEEERQSSDEMGVHLGGFPETNATFSLKIQGGASRRTLHFKNRDHREDTFSTSVGVTHFSFEDQVQADVVVFAESQTSQKKLTPAAGVEISYSPQFIPIQVYAGALTGYRLPSLKETFGESELVVGNEELESEKNILQYATLGFSLKKLFVSGSLFQNEISDLIEYEAISSIRYKPFNFSKVRARGIEMRVLYEVMGTLSTTLFVVTQSVKNVENESEYYLKDIPGHPRQFGGAALDWKLLPKLSLGVDHDFQVSRNVNRANTQLLNDSHNTNLSLTFKEAPVSLRAQVVNVFNRENVDQRGSPRPPRLCEIGVEYTF